jgi:hypothetical protein
MRDAFFKVLMAILIIAGLLPAVLYFWVFHSGLEQIHSRWGEFGSFLSPVVSILAFVGLLYSIEVTRNQFQRQSEENGFFNLLNLHVNKVNQIAGGMNSELKGVEAFRYYADKFKSIYQEHCFDYVRSAMAYDTDKLPNLGYQFLYKKITRKDCSWAGEDEIKTVLEYFKQNDKERWEALKGLVDEGCSAEDRDALESIGALVFEDSSPESRIKRLSVIYEYFYENYGHLLGHYFRNMYYILQYADKTQRGKYFSRIYRAQLSRYELAMLFYNVMGPYTSDDFNRLVFKFDMLDDLYGPDLCYTAHEKRLNADLDARKAANNGLHRIADKSRSR